MTDLKKENTKPLIDTEESEEEISLVSSEAEVTSSNTTATLNPDINAEWDEPTTKKEHPLAAAIVVEDYDSDPWAQPENALLAHEEEEEDEDEQDLVMKQPPAQSAEAPSVATTTVFDAVDHLHEPIARQEEDQDTSAVKGFQNFEDTDKIDDLKVSGELPDWLTGEHFTVGPGTFSIKYSRKVEIDGLLQNSTAVYSFGHWFDALPLVNRFDLNGSRNSITYRNKLTSKRLIEKIRDHHGYAPPHPAGLFMSNTNQTVLSKILNNSSKPNKKPDAEPCGARILTSIPGLEGRLLTQNYANHIQELDPFDLKPTRLLTWSDINPLFKGTSSCPNGQYDSRTGEYINFTLEVGYQSVKYNFFSISDKNPKGSIIASITAPMAYVNTFSITPKYIIFVICPILANAGGVKFNWNESIMDSFSFRATEPTLFYVISREKGDVIATYRSDPCFVFNHINAFEMDGSDTVYIDMICYPDDTIARQLTTEFLRNPNNMKPSRLMASEVRRYQLANIQEENLCYLTNNSLIPSKNSVSTRISSVFGYFKKNTPAVSDSLEYGDNGNYVAHANKWYSWMPVASFDKRAQPSIELPQINPKFKMYKHTIMYGLGFSASSSLKDGAIWDSIVKIDEDKKHVVASWHQDFCYPSEALFVPRPSIGPEDEVGEDEGVLISIVMNSQKATSFILILDAGSLKVLATADLERLVPLSFAHGSCRLREN
ncbi:retinal pigment epithelial membrane protein-domain-containing protein [Mucor mucedo]|uniref:retinal pigment epithelial membrane protein-domain-containing protein n=1 Tax=Mucor mucedo TaxID=29922 RepID=UPI00221F5FC8|nr:retinal pigment epithelial membrane protein-domain-containing protein [Mucor mucedo]KAI7886393.1 retinal pigment epithelial membrane protein-domain-containing protein [Mucor mucedo]